MSPSETIHQHLQICDEIHQLSLEENRLLKQQQRAPDAEFLERKRALLSSLEGSLAALKALNISLAAQAPARPGIDKALMEKARSRIMQILHLDRENEQLLFRYSMGAARPAATPPPPSQLQKLYGPRL
jgi:hypothetical protein